MVKMFFFINYLMSILNINNKIFDIKDFDIKNKILFSRKLNERNITLNDYFININNDILFDDYNFYLIVLLDFI